MAHEIFISYSRQDKELVHPFAKQICEAVGRDCWIDLLGVKSGEEFEEVIMQAIDECQVVLFMLSDESLKSSWTKREVYYAEGEGKHIVPVLVNGDKLRGWFKFHFGNVDYIDIRKDEHREKLVRNLRSWLGVKEDVLDKKGTKRNTENEHSTISSSKQFVNTQLTIVKREEKYGYVDENGNEVIPCQWTFLGDFHEGLAKAMNEQELWGFINKRGDIVIPCQWMFASDFSEGLAVAVNEENRRGFIDKTGKVAIRFQWAEAMDFSEGLACVRDFYRDYGFIDKTGEEVIQCGWQKAGSFHEGLALVMDWQGKYGFINKRGRPVIQCQWHGGYWFSEGLAPVEDKQGKWGYIDKTGKVVIPCQWEKVYPIINGKVMVVDDNKKLWEFDKNEDIQQLLNKGIN